MKAKKIIASKVFSLCLLLQTSLVFGDEVKSNVGTLGYGASGFQEEMQTDRPDFTEGTRTIEAGHFQLELGPLYSYDDSSKDAISKSVVSENLVRIGLTEISEIRVAWLGEVYSEGIGEKRTFEQMPDFSLGTKVRLFEDELAWLQALSLISEIGIPVDQSDGLSDRVEPRLKLLWGTEVSDFAIPLSLSGNFNLSYINTNEAEYPESAVSFSVGTPIVGNLAMYHEFFGVFPVDHRSIRSENYINSGFTYAYHPDLQFDIRIGAGLDSASEDLFSGLGISVRL